MRVSTFVRSCQFIHHPLCIDTSVSLGNELAEATARFIMDRHVNDVVELLVLWCKREILIVKYVEFFKRILHQAKSIALCITHTQIYRTRAPSLVQHRQSWLQSLRELQHIPDSIRPRLAITSLVLLHWVLLSHFFTHSCKFTETSNRPHEPCEADINERMRAFFVQIIDSNHGILIHRVFSIPVQGSQLDQFSTSSLSPRTNDRASSSRVLRKHVELDHLGIFEAWSGTDARILIQKSFRRMRQSDIMIPHQQTLHQLDTEPTTEGLQLLGKLCDELELLISQKVIVLP